MASFIRSSLQVIVPLLRVQLCSSTKLLPSSVFPTLLEPDETPHYGPGPEILIQLGAEVGADGSSFPGAGRVDNRRTRTIRFVVRTRGYTDKYPADTARLYGTATVSHVTLEDMAYNSMCWFQVTDDDGNALTAPGEPGNFERPRRERAVNPNSNSDPSWVWSAFSINFEYERNLDQSWQ